MLKTRVKTAAVIIVLAAAVLWFSYIPWVMRFFAALLGILSVWEIFGACGAGKKSAQFVCSVVFSLLWPFVSFPKEILIPAILFPAALLWFAAESRDLTHFSVPVRLVPLFLSVITAVFFKSFALLRESAAGLATLLLAILACVMTDTAAYFVGRALGRHKLAPHISPKKTVEGSTGGIIFTAVISIAYCCAVSAFRQAPVNIGRALLYSVTAAVVAQAGDLFFSVIKRIAGIKDYGKLLPGHGGILDRFDSMLFTIPYTLLFVQLFPLF